MRNEHKTMHICARCGGKFPHPGMEKNGKLYCCDKCAEGPKGMIPKMLPMILGLLGLGFLVGHTTKTKK